MQLTIVSNMILRKEIISDKGSVWVTSTFAGTYLHTPNVDSRTHKLLEEQDCSAVSTGDRVAIFYFLSLGGVIGS
jgi:hypothetical protein